MKDRRTGYYGSALILGLALFITGVCVYLAPQIDNVIVNQPAMTDDSHNLASTVSEAEAVPSSGVKVSISTGKLSEEEAEPGGGQSRAFDDLRRVPDFPFARRVATYLVRPSGYEGTPQERVRAHLRRADLPELYRMLEGSYDTNGYLNLLAAICILEEDKEKALSTVNEYIKSPVDWKSFIDNRLEYENWKDRYTAVLTLGYLDYGPANEFLVSLLSVDDARELVLESAGPKEKWVLHNEPGEFREALLSSGRNPEYAWIEHSALILGRGAAWGLAVTWDESTFQHVEDTYRAIRSDSVRGLNAMEEAWEFQLVDTIGRYRFFKDKGWEEGFRIVGSTDGEGAVFLYREYYPNPEEF